MTATRLAFAALATACLLTTAFAQDSSAKDSSLIDDLDIDRINANQIEIEFEYDGSACERLEPARLGEIVDGTLAVTFPTVATAEVCTMQVVEIEGEQVVDADASVRMVEVTLLRPDGSVLAIRTERVDND